MEIDDTLPIYGEGDGDLRSRRALLYATKTASDVSLRLRCTSLHPENPTGRLRQKFPILDAMKAARDGSWRTSRS